MLVFSACGPLVGWLFDRFGTRRIMPFGVIVLFPLLTIFQRGSPREKGLTQLGDPDALPKGKGMQRRYGGPSLPEAIHSYRFWTLGLISIISGAGFSGLFVHAVVYMDRCAPKGAFHRACSKLAVGPVKFQMIIISLQS